MYVYIYIYIYIYILMFHSSGFCYQTRTTSPHLVSATFKTSSSRTQFVCPSVRWSYWNSQ